MERSIAGEAQISGHSNSTIVDVERLLTCVVGKMQSEIIIHAEDQPFWEYYYTKEDCYTSVCVQKTAVNNSSFECKIYTPPLRAASALRNLTSPLLAEDLIGRIASFANPVERCRPCHEVTFKPNFLEKCSAPAIEGTLEEQKENFDRVLEEVQREGGTCRTQHTASAKSLPLESCMHVGLFTEIEGGNNARFASMRYRAKNRARRFAACYAV